MARATRTRPLGRVIAMAFALVAGFTVVVPVVAPTPAEARIAEGGVGEYRDVIEWFEWEDPGEVIPAGGITQTNTRSIGDADIVTTCTISDIDGELEAYRPGTWVGDLFDDLYNIGGTGTSNQLIAGLSNHVDGQTVSFKFSCSVTVEVIGDVLDMPMDGLVIADAESSNWYEGQQEYMQATPLDPDGDPQGETALWRIIDHRQGFGCSTPAMAERGQDGTLRLRPEGRECGVPGTPVAGRLYGGPMAVAFMEDATSAEIELKGGGKSAIALGVVLSTDFGDAPESYGEAGSLFAPTWTGGEITQGLTNITQTFSNRNNLARLTSQAGPMLGATVDAEGAHRATPDGSADDDDAVPNDEDALDGIDMPDVISVVPGQVWELPGLVPCTLPGPAGLDPTAFVAGHLDWNNNGTFEPNEVSNVAECEGDPGEIDLVPLQWIVPPDASNTPTGAHSFLRLRAGYWDYGVAQPEGMTAAGEVEDHAVSIEVPTLAVTKSSTATADSRPGDDVTYTVTATNTSDVPFTAGYPAHLFDDLTGVLDDATYNNDATANPEGTLTYTEPRLHWTGELARDESVTLTYTATLDSDGDGNVRNVAWEPDDPATPTPPLCSAPGGVDAETGEPCAVEQYLLPRLTIEKTADMTDVPALGEVVTFTVTVRNPGPGEYTTTAPASFTDDLTAVLDDADLVPNSINASAGTATLEERELSWAGPVAASGEVTVTYQVTYNGTGDQILANRVCVPASATAPGVNPCDDVQIPAALPTMWKEVSASQTPAEAGTVLTYTLHFGNEDGLAASAVDAVDILTHVLDDATLSSGPTATGGLTASLTDDRIHVTGEVPAGGSATVTYAVTIDPDGDRGDDVAANFLMDNDPPNPPPAPETCLPPAESELPNCTTTPIASVTYAKTVVASPEPVEEGTVLTYTVRVTSTGETTATIARDDVLTDVLDDADLTSAPVSDTESVTVTAVEDGRFSIGGELAAGEVATITYRATVRAQDERGNHSAANFLVPTGQAPPTECVAGSTACTVTPLPQIVSAKSVTPESGSAVQAGQEVSYTLTFTNTGDAAGSVNFTDHLEGVLDDAEVTVEPVVSDAALTATREDNEIAITGALAAGQTVTVTYTVTVLPDGERDDNLIGNFLVETGETPPGECLADDPNCTTNPVPEIVASKAVTSTDAPAVAGSVLTYTLFFENTGQAPGAVSFIDDLSHVLDDANVTVEPASDNLTVVREDNRIFITGEVPAGTIRSVSYQVTINADGARGDDVAANFLLAGDPTNPPPTPETPECADTDATCTTTPIAAVTYAKSVEASATPIEEGTVLTYTITVNSTGTATTPVAIDDVLTDVLDDAQLTSGPTSDTASVTVSEVTDGRFAIGGELAADETAEITYEVVVNAQVDRGNHSAGNFLVPPGETPPTVCEPGSTDCTVTPLPLISTSKTVNPASGATVVAGQQLTYTLTFTNTGDGAGSVAHTDHLADVLDDASLTTVPAASDAALTALLGDDTIDVTGVLAAGQSVTVTYTVTVLPDGERDNNSLGNFLVETGETPPGECLAVDPNCTTNPVPLLDAWKQVSYDTTPVAAGAVLTYTLFFENTGTAAARVDFVDDLTHVTDDAAVTTEPSSEDLTVNRDGDRISITGVVPVGETYSVTYAVTVLPVGSGGDNIAANFLLPNDPENPPTAPEDPVCQPTDQERPECTATPIGRLLTSKAVASGPGPVVTGSILTFTLTYHNEGEGPVTVDHTDTLGDVIDDADLVGEPTVSDPALQIEPTGPESLAVTGTLQPGQRVTVTFQVQVRDEAQRGNNSVNNFIVPTGTTPPDECLADNPNCTVTPLPNILAEKSVSPDSGTRVLAGQEVTYTLTFSNVGQAAGPVNHVDRLAGVYDDAELTAGPTISPDGALIVVPALGDGFRVLGELGAGEVATVTYTVTVLPDFERGDNRLTNFLLEFGDETPDDCTEGVPNCTANPIPLLDTWKSVSADSTPVAEGTVLTYTLFFENSGQAVADVDMVDFLTHVLDDAAVTAEPSSDDLTVTRVGARIDVTGQVPAGETHTVTYQVTVLPDADRGDDVATNFLLPNDPANPPVPPTDPVCEPTDTERPDCTVTPIGRLVTAKAVAADSDPVVAGTVLTYTLTFENVGPGPVAVDHRDILTDVIDDAIPIGTAEVSDDALTVGPDGLDTVAFTGELAPGQVVTVTYSVQVNDEADRGNNSANNFLVPAGTTPPGECLAEDPNCTVTALPNVSSAKSVDPASGSTVLAGQEVTYTLTFTNDGQAAGPVAHTDHLADILDDAELTTAPAASDVALSAEIVDGELNVTGTLSAGQAVTVTYTVTVLPDGERGDNVLGNFLTRTGEEPPTECDATDPNCTTNPVPDLEWSKSVEASATPVVAGTVLTYTITVTNTGTATGPVAREDVLTGVLDDATLTDAPTSDTDTVTVSDVVDERFAIGGELAADATATITYTVTVNDEGQRGDNSADNFLVVPGQEPPAECEAGDVCTSTPLPNVSSFKSVDPASGTTVVAGQVLTYTLTFSNSGQAAGPVAHTDQLAGVLDDAEVTTAPVASDAALSVELDDDELDVAGTLTAGQTVTVTYQVTVLPDGERGDNVLGNFLAPTGTEPPAECDAADPNCTTNPVPLLDAWKSVSADVTPVAEGTVLTYTLFFENTGAAAATVDFVDDLTHVTDDADVTLEPSSEDLTVSRDGDRISITGEVPVGETFTVTYEVTVRADAERGDDVAVNFLLVNDPEDPPVVPEVPVCQPSDGERPDCTVTPIARLLTSKAVSADSDPVVAGTVLTYTLTFDNQGPGPVTVGHTDVLTDVLDDAELTSVPDTESGLTVSEVIEGSFTIDGSIAAGETATVTYQVTVHDEADRGNDSAANFLVPSGTTPPAECLAEDPNCTVTSLPNVSTAKSVDPASGTTVVAGEVLSYTLTFTNSGQAAGPVDHTDHLARLLDDATVTTAAVASDEALHVTSGDQSLRVLGTLAAGQTVTVTYQVTVLPDGERGDNVLGNFLAPTGTDPAAECDAADPNCTTNPVPLLDAWKSVTADTDPVAAGTVLTYTLSFENTGAAAATVDFVDDLTHVTDDGDVTLEPVAEDLAVTRDGDRIAITGEVPVGETFTVSYEVTLRADGERGDDVAANFLLVNDPENPPAPPTDPICDPADGERPDCTVTPIGALVAAKSVDPASGTYVGEGQILTYTLTFTGTGQAPAVVDHVDHLGDVLDDASWLDEVTVSDGLTVVGPEADSLHVTGTVGAGETATVTYRVRVFPYEDQGNGELANFLAPVDEVLGGDCEAGDLLCTSNPITPPAGPTPPPVRPGPPASGN